MILHGSNHTATHHRCRCAVVHTDWDEINIPVSASITRVSAVAVGILGRMLLTVAMTLSGVGPDKYTVVTPGVS
ncbi:hypothetical protein ABIB56_003698 [Glaciihabitans sp. UYNi722]